MKHLQLQPRLRLLADMVPAGAHLADIGTDHGYLPVWLMQQGRITSAIAADIGPEPLAHARRTAAEYGAALDLRLCDGLRGIAPHEADTLVMAGMGGETIIQILTDSPWPRTSGCTLLLQPQTKVELLRRWLSENGYACRDERLVWDKGKLYVVLQMAAGEAFTPEEARQEADYVLSLLESYPITCPVVYDWEPITFAEGARTDHLEHEVLTAHDRDAALEYDLFCELRNFVASQAQRVQQTAQAVAQLDVLCSFAAVAVHNHYCKPEVDLGNTVSITAGRHPVVEQMLKNALFVPNDTLLGSEDCRTAIITGPNMAGKSTYMRQVALIVLMAQMGSFVPAQSAHIGIVDRLFTRIGASDDLASGQSTFMVEMTEVSEILHQATPRSLLILDEIGRGTSTFDGMSIARAVLEFCADPKRLGAKTLFATHYHELTELEGILPGVKNYSISIKKRGDELIFLRKIVPGGADRSYGIEVAKLAGLPNEVVKRANVILKELEQGGAYQAKPREETEQVSLDAIGEAEVLAAIRRAQPDTMSPIEAMQLLYELKQKLS